eukprot:1158678-Pelagomonas_calceolata.AAC.6
MPCTCCTGAGSSIIYRTLGKSPSRPANVRACRDMCSQVAGVYVTLVSDDNMLLLSELERPEDFFMEKAVIIIKV